MNSNPLSSYSNSMAGNSSTYFYPFQGAFFIYACFAGVTALLFSFSITIGFSFFILFIVVGLLWRRNEPPALSICLGIQWLFMVTGYIYQNIVGEYPGLRTIGHIDKAVWLSLLGLVTVAGGLRLGLFFNRHKVLSENQNDKFIETRYDIKRLFIYIMIVFSIDWFSVISPKGMWFEGAQLIYQLLKFRVVLLLLLILSILRQKEGFGYGIIAVLFVWLPSFTSQMSAFSGIFVLLFVLFLGEWRPWVSDPIEREKRKKFLGVAVAIMCFVLVMGFIWQGGLKSVWRKKHESGQISGNPNEIIADFFKTASEVTPGIEIKKAIADLAMRLSSDIGYFSLVLTRVPSQIPYENGKFLKRAVMHIIMPRILFPNKTNLGSDSWLVITYAGVKVAGEEVGSSVGLGYMAQSYIDFGIPWMFLPLYLLGVMVGGISGGLRYFSPSRLFYQSALLTIIIQHFSNYGVEIAKCIGGMLHSFIFFSFLLLVVGKWLHRKLILPPR